MNEETKRRIPLYLTPDKIQNIEQTSKLVTLRKLASLVNKKVPDDMIKLTPETIISWLILEGAILPSKALGHRSLILPFGKAMGVMYHKEYGLIFNQKAQSIIIENINFISQNVFVEMYWYKEPVFKSPYTYVRIGYSDRTRRGSNKDLTEYADDTREKFYLSPEMKPLVPITHHPISIKEFSFRLNMFIDNRKTQELAQMKLTKYLRVYGYTKIVKKYNKNGSVSDTQTDLIITNQGIEFGIVSLNEKNKRRYKYTMLLTAKAQFNLILMINGMLKDQIFNPSKNI